MTEIPPRVRVLLPLPLPQAFDYEVGQGLALDVGDLVRVPLGPRMATGVVSELCSAKDEMPVAPDKLKKVAERLDVPPLPPALLKFVLWVAGYTLTPPGAVLRLVLRSPGALEPVKTSTAYLWAEGMAPKMTGARKRVRSLLEDGLARTSREICEEAGVSSGVVRGLADLGALQVVPRPLDLPFSPPDPDLDGPRLSHEQEKAAAGLRSAVQARTFSATLLDGVPGSGKTEVYFEAVAEALRQDRQALVLLPEIALTAQFLDRFAHRFGCPPAVWHSDLSQRERRRTWRKIAEGQAKVVIGARSALFLPFRDLGVIVVDEEHDTAFKQEEGVIYHARDMAVVRASIEQIPIILASATPSLETVANVAQGKYAKFELPARHGPSVMPDVAAVDMRADGPARGRWLSPVLTAEVAATLGRGEQALLFLNRRGYAPLTLCRTCGHRLKAPDSDSWLVEHRFSNQLVCHQTGFTMAKPRFCPNCGTEESLIGCGPGVERIAEEAARLFPDARLAILSSDTLTSPRAAQEAIARVLAGQVDLLIGTQIVAKGYHFPDLTLVGVVDADLGLSGGDLRAGERTFQLLFQVAGRAGRAARPGKVLLQSYMPEHPVIEALVAGDRDAFLRAEAGDRERFQLPPFGRLAGLILSSPDQAEVSAFARQLARAAPQDPGVRVLGPAPAPFGLLRGRHRFRLLVKAHKDINLQTYLRRWLGHLDVPSRVRMAVDVDPYSFL